MGDHGPLTAGAQVAEERRSARMTKPLREFLDTEVAGGLVLLAAVVVALAWANSPWSGLYDQLWSTNVSLTAGGFELAHDLRHWVNDGLMVLFFFVVGLEIKRELTVGDLSTTQKAALPAAAAVGGMILPAAIYFALNRSGQPSVGWGIPMATDIALAVGMLALLSRGVPPQLRVLLLTLAIVDDIGAVLVIAMFYTASINWLALGIAIGLVTLIAGMRTLHIWWVPAYTIVGTGVWVATLESGVHATVAGVVLGLMAPARPLKADAVAAAPLPQEATEAESRISAGDARVAKLHVIASVPVTERLEHLLHPWTSFLVLPVFALANAGVQLALGDLTSAAQSSVSWGIAAGLVVGKVIGISGASWAAIRLGAALPQEVRWQHVVGMSALAGIGFTMSLFITDLAFSKGTLLQEAKVGILFGSLLAAVLGWSVLRTTSDE